jgi:hypothetical protein
VIRKIALTSFTAAALTTGALASAVPAFANDTGVTYLAGANTFRHEFTGQGLNQGAAAEAARRAMFAADLGVCTWHTTTVRETAIKGQFQADIVAYCTPAGGQFFDSFSLEGADVDDLINEFVRSSEAKGCTPVRVEWSTNGRAEGTGWEFCPVA